MSPTSSPSRQMQNQANPELETLFHVIASGNSASAVHLTGKSPALASSALPTGASRQSPSPYFFPEIGHHVYTGDTALHVAAAAYNVDIAKTLIALGADVHAKNRRGAQPLHYATDGNPTSARWNPLAQAKMVEYLIAAGANVNAVDKSGVAPLHRAVRNRCASVVRVLLAHGANARMGNGNGSTPLHLAVQNTGRGGAGATAAKEQQAEIINMLLQHGALLTDKDQRGKSVAECISAEWVKELVGAS